jgi:hypothetical protein
MSEVNKVVDAIVKIMENHEAPPITCEGMDTIYRAYLHWISHAHSIKEDPNVVRKSLIHIVVSMMYDMSIRMSNRHVQNDQELWLGEFMYELKDELIAELANDQESPDKAPIGNA